MRPYVELYIADRLVEFPNPPEIHMTYTHEDLHNPTVVKNSYSKTVTIDGTPRNNQIFGTFFNMQRVVSYGSSSTGAYFDASKKVPFTLYRNGEKMEHGYCKLDSVKTVNKRISYNITLYGGLGQFLYALSHKEDGEQMRLSDLNYGGGDGEFDLEVSKTTIKEAWNHINGVKAYSPIYDKINFAPCYNGIPKDFSADKVAIDVNSFQGNNPQLFNQFKLTEFEKDGYARVNGWVMGELTKEYDEWQMKDLRSYLQRPVFRVKEIIKACCNRVNNGGHTVDLDPEFFNTNNPYYEDAWMTLPLLTEMDEVKNVDATDFSTTITDGKIMFTGLDAGSNYSMKVPVSFGANVSSSEYSLYTKSSVWMDGGGGENSDYEAEMNVARYVQLVAYSSGGTVLGGSSIYVLYSNGITGFDFSPVYKSPYNYVTGSYNRRTDGTYGFNNGTNYIMTIDFEYKDGMYFKVIDKFATVGMYGNVPDTKKLHDWYGAHSYTVNSWITDINSNSVQITFNKGMGFSINKKSLLNSEKTPCDYFLSYLKMFNLHIWQNEDDKIMVRLRKNYFTGDQYDLEDLIDRGSEINITPLTFDTKWYTFSNEYCETEMAKSYKDETGVQYGQMKVDTNFNFNAESKNLFEGNVYKGTIQSRGRSRYYTDIYQEFTDDGVYYPPFMLDGVQTFLFNNSGDTKEAAYLSPKTTEKSVMWYDEPYYDVLPKPVFHDAKNEQIDGSNVLLFYTGKNTMKNVDGTRLKFCITDDIPEFKVLNDGEPCWIWSQDWDIVIDTMDYFPCFSRYITNENNWITHSWDFATPDAIYLPECSIDDSSNLYTQYWQPYIRDRYDVNTRVAECKVLLKERVVGDWLRRFYYWDGCWWIMNKITDYNPTSNGTTKCEMVKMNEPDNYRQ